MKIGQVVHKYYKYCSETATGVLIGGSPVTIVDINRRGTVTTSDGLRYKKCGQGVSGNRNYCIRHRHLNSWFEPGISEEEKTRRINANLVRLRTEHDKIRAEVAAEVQAIEAEWLELI